MEFNLERVCEAIALEQQLHPDETSERLAARILAESLPDAVRSMLGLFYAAENPEVRNLAREYLRENPHWHWWFSGYEFGRQKANERDGYPDKLFSRKAEE